MTVPEKEIRELRRENYNATVKCFRRVHDELAVLRVVPDDEPAHFEAGQYTTLGLGYWEPRVAGSQPEEIDEARLRKMVRRAYSFSSPILDEAGMLTPPATCSFCEFYIVLIREGEEKPPGLTPRIFVSCRGRAASLGKEGDRPLHA